jgi:N-acetylmuramoyl-L-alanine amidase
MRHDAYRKSGQLESDRLEPDETKLPLIQSWTLPRRPTDFIKVRSLVKLNWLLPLTAIALVSLTQSAWAGKLVYWKFNKALNRIEFVTNEGVEPQAKFVSNPGRLIIDVPDTTVDKSKQKKTRNVNRFIREVRVGQLNRNTARLVIEMKPQYTLRPDDIQIRSLSPNRWFVQIPTAVSVGSAISQISRPIEIDIDMPGGLPDQTITINNPIPLGKRIPFPDMPPVEPPVSVEPPRRPWVRTPIKVRTPIRTASDPPFDPPVRTPVRAGATVVAIDPGHGGADPGAVGINGLQEKIVVFSVSSQVAQQLRRKGINAVLTRKGDQEIDLAPRVATAVRIKADLFVSIHANSISLSRPDINGLETYYYASAQGRRLAKAIHNRILRSTNMTDKGVRQARFYVIRKTKMPAVLVEIGFVTGSQDAARLASSAGRTQLAEAIAQGIIDYIQGP